MFEKQQRQNGTQAGVGNEMSLVEAARAASQSALSTKESPHGDEKISLFWRVFGGTILSMVCLGSITLYNNISSNIADIRKELNQEREIRSEYVKKDEFNTRTSTQYERIRSLDALKIELEGIKERGGTNTVALDSLKKDVATNMDAVRKDVTVAVDTAKKDGAALDLLKERIVALEMLRKELASIESLREKVASNVADVKSLRDEAVKYHQEIERNKAADLERKTSRDAQFKQVEDTLKELQKGLQDCREKIARLEGMQPAPNPARTGTALPGVAPAGAKVPAEESREAPSTSKPPGN